MSTYTASTIIGTPKITLPWAYYRFTSINGSSSFTISNTNATNLVGSSFTLVDSSNGTVSPFGTFSTSLNTPIKGLYRFTLTGPRCNLNSSNIVMTVSNGSTQLARSVQYASGPVVGVLTWEGPLESAASIIPGFYSDSGSGTIFPEGFLTITCLQVR